MFSKYLVTGNTTETFNTSTEYPMFTLNTFKQSIPPTGINYLSKGLQSTILLNETLQDLYDDKICVSWKTLTFTVLLTFLFCLLIIITIIGNTLVILSVITTRRLRTGKTINYKE